MTAVFGVPVDAAYHLVLALTNVLSPALGGLAAVAAIVAFTMAIRLLLTPLSFRALRGQAAMTRLAPQIQELRKRHGREPERLQRELTALYAREGTSLLAGFVPLLARDLFGVPLGAHWLSGGGAGLATAGPHAAVFPAVLAILALICWLSVWVARQMTAGPASAASGTGGAAGLLTKVLPYITVVIAAFAPLAAAVYLVVTVSWSVGERRVFAARSRRRLASGPGGGDQPRAANTLGDRAQRS